MGWLPWRTRRPAPDRTAAEARDALARGVALYKAGRIDEAAAQLELGGSRSPPGSAPRRHYFKYMIELLAFRRGDLDAALDLCAKATAEAPDDIDAWVLTSRVQAERGEKIAALRSLRAAWKLGPDKRVAYELCKLLDVGGQRRLAVAYGVLAYELGHRSDHLMHVLGNSLVQLGEFERALHFISMVHSPTGAATYGRTVRGLAEGGAAARRLFAENPRLAGQRHIAIGGENYVGSTLLGLLLGSLPGVAFAGETQTLTRRWDVAGQADVTIDFAADAPSLFSHCRTCGPGCATFDTEFRAGLIREPLDTYGKIARRLGAAVLVTADKAVTRLDATDPLFSFDLIVLYKPPEAWVRSYVRERGRAVSGGLLAADAAGDVARWLERWCNTYEGLLRLPIPMARRTVLNWERFVAAPPAHFERLLARFGLAGDAAVFDSLAFGCFVGGNETDNLQAVLRAGRVTFKPSTAPPLPEDMQGELRSHRRSIALAARLERLYRVDFAGCEA